MQSLGSIVKIVLLFVHPRQNGDLLNYVYIIHYSPDLSIDKGKKRAAPTCVSTAERKNFLGLAGPGNVRRSDGKFVEFEKREFDPANRPAVFRIEAFRRLSEFGCEFTEPGVAFVS